MSHAGHRDWRQGDKRREGRASGPSPGVWTPAAEYCVLGNRLLGRAPSTAQHLHGPARGVLTFLCVYIYTWFLVSFSFTQNTCCLPVLFSNVT